MIDSKNIFIDDTTLRDGEQMPGVYFSADEKLEIATRLNDLGLERIELFAAYNDSDRKAAKMITSAGFKTRIAAWCRANTSDISDAMKSGVKEVGISHPVSDLHLEKKLGITRSEALKRVEKAVDFAVEHGLRVFVHGEDSTRSDWDFEKKIIDKISACKAETYRVCDTVGKALPLQVEEKMQRIIQETSIKQIEFHGHDDFGFATSNTLAALKGGAQWASTTVLGIGERAGNTALEKILLILNYHFKIEKYDLSNLTSLAEYVSKSGGFPMPLNKAVVGRNVFAHESGIHVHGILKNPLSYEPFPPKLVGAERKLIIGKHSGKSLIKHKLKELYGENALENEKGVDNVMKNVKELFDSERKSALTDVEFKKIARDEGFSKNH
ncbi:MAG: LeuA family protein [Candidatus Micrarchaeia archaeon]